MAWKICAFLAYKGTALSLEEHLNMISMAYQPAGAMFGRTKGHKSRLQILSSHYKIKECVDISKRPVRISPSRGLKRNGQKGQVGDQPKKTPYCPALTCRNEKRDGPGWGRPL
jgi:hypothetical protein